MIKCKRVALGVVSLALGIAGCGGGADRPATQDEQKKAQDLARDFRSQHPMPKAVRARK